MPVHLRKISAIITTHNSEKTIARTIRSILDQHGIGGAFDIEIIVIDDCSTDKTPEIIKEFDVKFFSTGKNSGGPNKGRNLGLDHATGQFLCIVDHDDEWHPDRIERLSPYLDKARIVTSGYNLVDDATGKKTVRGCVPGNGAEFRSFEKNRTFKDRLSRNKSGQNTYLGSIIYSSELKHIRFEEQYGMIDYDWLLALLHGQSTIEVCSALYSRHVEGGNLSLNERYRLNDHKLSLETVEKYRKQYPREVHKSVKRINGSLARYFYLVGKMPEARRYFVKSSFDLYTLLYIVTSFAGSGIIKRNFKVFG